MTLLRSPIRNTTRSPLRGPLDDAFGGGNTDPIAALFADGTDGAYFNLYTANALWQDTGKTVPAVANDDPVRVVVPTAGTGADWVAPSDASRPLLKISGGVRWLEFDGTDDRMLSLFTVSQPWTRVTSVRILTRTSGRRLYSGGTTQSGEFYINGATSGGFSFFDGATRNFSGQLADNTDGVIIEEHNSPSGSRMATDDGPFTAGGNSGATVPGGWNIGSLYNGAFANSFANFRFYGGFMIRLLTSDEIGMSLGQL